MDKQKALLQGLWRKAVGTEETLRVPCQTESNAKRLRFALYNAVRDVRVGKVEGDETLKEAIANCTISFDPEDKSVVLIQQKVMMDLMQVVAGVVGDAPGLQKTEEEMAMEASQARLMEKLSGLPDRERGIDLGLPRVTPYYTR